MTETKEFIQAVKELLDAAKPFINDDIVTETTGTIPLVERLESAVEEIDDLIGDMK